VNKWLFIFVLFTKIVLSQDFKEKNQIIFIDGHYKIEKNVVIIPQSVLIYQENDTLVDKVDYLFNQTNNNIFLLNRKRISNKFTIEYEYIPLKKNYRIHEVLAYSEDRDTTSYNLSDPKISKTNNIFKNLNKNGSIFRAFRLNSNQDLVFESGINLSINGNITEDLEINAVLNDESSPIQPEGSSQRISEIDKVYLELIHKNFSTTLGDYNYAFNAENNLEFKRRLTGLKINFNFKPIKTESNFSSARSNFNRMIILTKDAVQGPYKLEAINKNKDIVIIAGSERVYLDGTELKRGLNYDYFMEYSNGSIQFTSRNLIKSNQELIIEYQYVESFQRFQKSINVHSVEFNTDNYQGKIIFFGEEDDIKNPLNSEEELSEFEKILIKDAGNEPAKASYSSIRLAENNNGFYDYDFSPTFNDSVLSFKENQSGKYNAVFSHVGEKRGRYERISKFDNQYKYVGKSLGSYEPVILLSIPKKNNIFYSENKFLSENIQFDINTALNSSDQNILSELDEETSRPLYINSKLGYQFTDVFFDRLSFKHVINYRDKSFQFFDASIPIYFSNQYGIRDTDLNPFIKEIKNSVVFEKDRIEVGLNYDRVDYKQSVNAYTYGLSSDYKFNKNSNLKFEFKQYKTDDKTNEFHSDYINSGVELNIREESFKIIPRIHFTDRKIRDNRDYRIKNISYGQETSYQLSDELLLSYSLDYSEKTLRDSSSVEETIPFSNSFDHGARIEYRIEDISNVFTFKYRDLKIDDFFEGLASADKKKFFYLNYIDSTYKSQKSYLIENQFKIKTLRKKLSIGLNYRANSELVSKKELIYRKVAKGIGNYRLENGIYIPDSRGDYIQFILPTNDFESVHKVSTILTTRLKELNSNKDDILSNISFSSRLKLADENKSDNSLNVYSYSPSTFFSSTSINSSIELNNILSLYRGRKDFSFEYQQLFQKSLTKNFSNDVQGNNNKNALNSNRLVFSYLISERIQGSNNLTIKSLVKDVSTLSEFNRDINAYSVNQEFNYTASQSLFFKNKLEFSLEENTIPFAKIEANAISLELNAKYVFDNNSYINANYQFTKVRSISNPNNIILPYEMFNGKRIGVNQEWTIESLYKISEEFFANLNYTGRKDVIEKEPFHLLKFELRVVF
jgi:hypothetical protein